MGTRGPIPDPSSGRSQRGRNTLKRASTGRRASKVAPPAFVVASPAAAAFWRLHAPLLIEAKRLRPELSHTFGMLCLLAADCDRYAAALAKEGDVLETPKGAIANPTARLLRDARRDYVALARDFGLTAASDARIPIEESDGQEADPKAAKFRTFTGA